ncbi:hypothetical protein [Sulfurovum sp.]|uniref:hypothetical protein n=1 Tax=Sulfurovum sp. TaxID=1969726 RepID=UPI0025F6272C|nr:hypothetical protein [Sulfurovum sp.]
MVQKTYETHHNSTTVTPRELLEFGLDPAVLWNIDRDKQINKQIMIVSALKNGYSTDVINKLAAYFGTPVVLKALNKYRDRVSDTLFKTVENQLKIHSHAA